METNKRTAGFTIVELLIIIVVIAILASITVVAYRGIQERTKTAVINEAVQAWETTIHRATIEGFLFPIQGESCLGLASDFPAANGFPAGSCVLSDGQSAIVHDQNVFTGWPLTTTRPKGSLPTTTFSGSGFTLKARGAWIDTYPSQRFVQISWVPQNSGSCGSGIVVFAGDTDLSGSYCAKQIPY